ncbi:MAG: polysaccharide pyruvyl transferase CsaB [Bacillota bacterium]|nr:polysaccharide pyruvyl transferase CsaB [Bacillota bacterium]
MKVLHLIGGGDVGGAKSHVLSLVQELGKHIDVKLISFRKGAFADEARVMGINVEVVRTGNIISDVRKVISIIRSENYQLTHSHGAKANMIAVLVSKFAKVPTVTTVHSDYRLDYLQSFIKRVSFGIINTIALRFIDFYVAVSKNFKDMLIGRKFDADKIFTVYNGINFDNEIRAYSRKDFIKKYNLAVNDDDVLIGILVRLTPVKGLNVFINAAKEVVKKNPNVKFVIGGEGEEKKSLENKVNSLGLDKNLFFLGFVNDPYEFMSNIDINVLTSISESFPYSILEGTRVRRATVSSNVGGLPDLIDHGINGFLFNPGDYKKLAEYLLKLSMDKSLRDDMGSRIYLKASEKFSLKNMCKTQLDIYESVLENHSALTKPTSHPEIIISGYYGFKNIGDDAMLMAITENLRQYKNEVKIMVLSRQPLETKSLYNVDSIFRFNILRIIRAMKRGKLFINGGGNLIQDNTSTRSLMYYLFTIWLAKKLDMKVMIYANGIGPINRKINRKITTYVLNKVDVITLRENSPSMQEIDNLSVKSPKVIITSDPATTIGPASSDVIDKIFSDENISPQGPFIGFSIRKWRNLDKYEQIIADIADYVYTTHGLKPVFIPMHYPADLIIAKKIISKMKSNAIIINKKYSVSETIGIINRMDILVAMRLHALIFAACHGIPLVGLVYEPKVEGFLKSINQPSAGHVKELDFETLKNTIEKVWADKVNIKKQLIRTSEELKEKALENAKIAIELVNDTEL